MVAVSIASMTWLRAGLLTSALLHQWSADWGRSGAWAPGMPDTGASHGVPKRIPRPEAAHRSAAISALPLTWSARSVAAGSRHSAFGIARGTWIPVLLTRAITGVGSHEGVLQMRARVSGRWRSLPKGTLLSARTAVVPGSDRLHGVITGGVTPLGETVRFDAALYDRNHLRGLPALIGRTRHDPRGWGQWLAQRLSMMSRMDLPPSLARGLAGAQGASAAPSDSLYVAPQPAYVQILKGF